MHSGAIVTILKMSIAIKVENLSKAYQLGEIGTGTVSRDLERWLAKVRGKEDPFLKIGQTNDRTVKGVNGDVVWSLKDINFEIKQGDAVGVIGRNGAGKSTLLKVLSRVTSPTTGRIIGRGRIASLLEVGTGFHPELTGRENIFLNGAILGMRKREIKSKFDEIVSFAGVDRYVDTPVKRYSSGMYVRLAFAVAAHLESEVLIVDEVLAVGDAEFQKKCLGKMQDIREGEGRTILFVSHNIASIRTLCNKGIILKNGTMLFQGEIEETIQKYQSSLADSLNSKAKTDVSFPIDDTKEGQILAVSIRNKENVPCSEFDVFDEKYLYVTFETRKRLKGSTAILSLQKDGIVLFWSFLSDFNDEILENLEAGLYHYKVPLPAALKKGFYTCTIKLSKLRDKDYDNVENAVVFSVDDFSFDPTNKSFTGARPGIVPGLLKWERI